MELECTRDIHSDRLVHNPLHSMGQVSVTCHYEDDERSSELKGLLCEFIIGK